MSFLPILVSAGLTGLAGSAHCLGMCGGIGATLGVHAQKTQYALLYHVGRLLSYTLIGGVIGSILPLLGIQPAMGSIGIWIRRFTSLLLIFIGIFQIIGWQPLGYLERYGHRLWRPVNRLLQYLLPIRSHCDAFFIGMLWGFLPCGLIYAALTIAITTANPLMAMGVMFAFGLGTLPAMLGITLFSRQFMPLLKQKYFRQAIGLVIILLALYAFP